MKYRNRKSTILINNFVGVKRAKSRTFVSRIGGFG